MTHYSANPGRVRVSLFKPSGKWYADGAVDMSAGYEALVIHDALYQACVESHKRETGESHEGWPLETSPRVWLLDGGTVVCLDPYHKHAHPVMLTRATAERNPFGD